MAQPSASLTGHLQVTVAPIYLQPCWSSTTCACMKRVPATAQSTLAAARLPSPGLPAGLLINSTVFLLGMQILLKGMRVPYRCMQVHKLSQRLPAMVVWRSRVRNRRCHRCAGLTPAGVLHSWLLGTAIYSAFGPGGYTIVCLYFLLGSAVCAHPPSVQYHTHTLLSDMQP